MNNTAEKQSHTLNQSDSLSQSLAQTGDANLSAGSGTNRREGVGKEETIYESRFSISEGTARRATWRVLCERFLQQFVPQEGVVVDVGAGDGNFLLNIKAKRKIAVDLSAQVLALRSHGIEVLQVPATELAERLGEKVDLIFMSNFLEHLPEKRLVLEVLEAARASLKPGGKVMILQPNIRYVGPAYWDYIDHHIALTEWSLAEALNVTGFKIDRMIPRFLPYTAKSSLGKIAGGEGRDWMIKLYLRLPILWRIFGAQTFVVASVK